jgi:hypothetical protein
MIKCIEKCPVCGGKFKVEEYTEEYWGVVERHNYCDRCGYREEQCYSEVLYGFEPPIRKGGKGYKKYIKKNIRKRKRIKRKYNIKYGNKDWIFNYI